ncbi:MAG: hypothetical protein ACLGSA_13550 [Acidobacteriota bacterium]
MSFQFLGHYLLGRGVVTQAQIDEAAAYQAEANRRLGDLAVESGVLTPGQVEEILARQRETDLTFGMLAVSLGFARRRDMDALLFRQQVHLVHLGEALLTLGHLNTRQFCECLNDYAALEKAREAALAKLFEGHCASAALETLVDTLERAFLRFAHLPLKAKAALDERLLESLPLQHTLQIPLDAHTAMRFTLHLGREMLDALSQTRTRGDGGERTPEEALADVLDILGIIGRYLCTTVVTRMRPVPACPSAPDGQRIGGDSGKACLRLQLACPVACVGLTVALVTNRENPEVSA